MDSEKDELSTTSYSSITDDLIEKVSEIAESKGISVLRYAYDEAITEFCDELDEGLVIYPWPASRPGLSRAKVTVRMSEDIVKRMRSLAHKHGTKPGIFFRVGLIRWLARHGVEYKL